MCQSTPHLQFVLYHHAEYSENRHWPSIPIFGDACARIADSFLGFYDETGRERFTSAGPNLRYSRNALACAWVRKTCSVCGRTET